MGYSSRQKSSPWNPAEGSFFAAFLLWSAAGLVFTVERITPKVIVQWSLPDGLGAFVNFCLHHGDPILILLAAANTHLLAVRQWTAHDARNWAGWILVLSFGVEMLGVRTGLPFGDYTYTDRFGPLCFGVPLAIPLAWYVVVTNVLFVIRAVLPSFSPTLEAALGGLLCMLYDFTLEPFATTLKGYWLWKEGDVSPLNYPAWFVVSALLIRCFAPSLLTRYRLDPRPWLILAIMILIFLVTQWVLAAPVQPGP
jgi:uncharacterized membrane protein